MPTPTPTPAETDAPAVADQIALWLPLIGSITVALLSLIGVIVLFALQQRAARNSERQKAQDEAYARLLSLYSDVIAAARSGDTAKVDESMDQFLLRMMHVTWYIPTKDSTVMTWVLAKAGLAVKEAAGKSGDERAEAFESAFVDITLELRRWRYGDADTKQMNETIEAVIADQDARRRAEEATTGEPKDASDGTGDETSAER